MPESPEQQALASHYVSTYCQHGTETGDEALHRQCRLSCKTCAARCRCTCHQWEDTDA